MKEYPIANNQCPMMKGGKKTESSQRMTDGSLGRKPVDQELVKKCKPSQRGNRKQMINTI